MIITTFSYSRTAQPKQYESVKVEAQGVPGEGQNAIDAFAELAAFVDGQVNDTVAVAQGAAPKKLPTYPSPNEVLPQRNATAIYEPTTKPPLAGKGQTAPVNPTGCDGVDTPTHPPANFTKSTPMNPTVGSPTISPPIKSNKPKAAKKVKASDHEKELQYTIESESLEELAPRFDNLRTIVAAFGDGWEEACTLVADRYRTLNSMDADPAIQKEIIAALKAERQFLSNQRLQEAALT